MTKEEQHKRKMEQLMEFLQLPLVALLSRAVRNDLRHQFAKQKQQIVGITGRLAWTKQWWTALVHCIKHEKIFKQVYKLMTAALHGDGTLVVVCDTALYATSL
jgi:DNA-binding transcriptional regulator GbsR (MarR family)